jgi:zinc-ribbon domain
VASFCAKCGAEVPPDKQICPSCGTAAPAAAQPTAAPAKSGSCLKIGLIVVAILVVLGLIAMAGVGYVAWRVKKAIHVETGGNGQMTLNTPNGKVNITGNGGQMTVQGPEGKLDLNTSETYTAADLGTDLYPGAQSVKGGMRMESPTGSMVTGVFVTSDSKDQVVAFYKNKFGSAASTFDTNDGAILTLPVGDKESVMVTITGKPSENEGKTKIVIVHTKNNKAS